jgi:hypothetical protein
MPAMPDWALALLAFATCVALAVGGSWAISRGFPPGVAALLAIALAIAFGCHLKSLDDVRRERRARGLCVRCGYDLTGNVSGVCPECGTTRR